MIPTLLEITIIDFVLVQFVPGGPIEQIVAEMEGRGDVFKNIAGVGARRPHMVTIRQQPTGAAG